MSFESKIGDIAEVIMGQSPQKQDVNNTGDGTPLLNGPTEFSSHHPLPVQYTTGGRKFSDIDDILFCVRGSTTGRMNYADQKYAIGRGIAAIRGKNGYPTPYVRAVIEENLNRLLASATGSTFPNVGRDLLLSFDVQTVSPEEALPINDLIVSIEEKIELNTQTNQTLEQIAQAIFKSWFVDFEPVKAKMAAKAKLPSPSGRGAGGEGAGAEDTKNHHKKTPKHLLANARNLRQSATDAEQLLWKLLRGRQINNAKFRRQHPVGKYILDFYCHDLKLAIELDGSQHNEADYKQKDTQRTAWLNQQGIQVIRFWNNQVLQETEAVMETIYNTVANPPSPSPSPLTPLPEGEGDNEHPSVTLAAMSAISGKDEAALKQLQAKQPEAYAELVQTAALFPSAMEESELGVIPAGWEVSTVGESYKVVMGQSPKGTTYNEDKKGTLFYQGRAEFGWRFPSPRLYTTDPKRMATKGDVLMSVRAPVGDLNIALEYCCVGRGLSALLHNSGSTSFTYYQLKDLQRKVDTFNGEGTVFGSINQKDLKSLKIIDPDAALLEIFIDKITVFDQKIENQSNEIISLSSIRDTLLPKLLSGEIHPHPSPLPEGEGVKSPLPLGEDLGEGQP